LGTGFSTSIPDTDPRLANLKPPLDLQIRAKAKEVLIEDELSRRRLVISSFSGRTYLHHTPNGFYHSHFGLYAMEQHLMIAESRSSCTPTKVLRRLSRRPKWSTASARPRSKSSGKVSFLVLPHEVVKSLFGVSYVFAQACHPGYYAAFESHTLFTE
jgi:hypothetical protein